MKNKYMFLVLLVLAGIALFFFFNDRRSTLREDYRDFSIEDTASISRIFITTQSGDKADLQKVHSGNWQINGKYKARKDGVDLLLETFYRLDVKSPVPQTAFETVVKQLAASGTKVEVYLDEETKPEKVYYIGSGTANHHGTYMLLEVNGKKSAHPFITFLPGFYGYLSTRFFTSEDLWRDRSIFSYQPEEIASIDIRYMENPERSFRIEQDDRSYRIMRNDGSEIQPFEKEVVDEYFARFSSVHFEYLETADPNPERDSVLQSTPIHVIRVQKETGEVRELKTFYKPVSADTYDINTGEPLSHNLDRCYGWIDEKEFVTLQYVILDNLLITAEDIENSAAVDK